MLTYSQLREIQKKELESFELVKLDKDFYSKLREFLDLKKISVLKNPSFMEMRELENIKKVAKSIIAKRKEKLLVLAALFEQKPEGLAEEEQVFLVQIRKITRDSFSIMDSIFEEQNEAHEHKMKIKIVQPIEAYKGFDNNIYGPYKEGEEIILPNEEVQWLLKSKLAEHIHY